MNWGCVPFTTPNCWTLSYANGMLISFSNLFGTLRFLGFHILLPEVGSVLTQVQLKFLDVHFRCPSFMYMQSGNFVGVH